MDESMQTARQALRGGNGDPGRGALRRRLGAMAAASALFLFACASPEMRQSTDRGLVGGGSGGAPAWVGQPLDWNKLERVERWLGSSDAAQNDYWRVQGELTLAEGRLVFARQDLSSGQETDRILARLRGAQVGFQAVLADSDANTTQTSKARLGLIDVTELQRSANSARPSTAQLQPVASGDRISRSAWRARAANPSNMTVTRGGYNRITVHHTAEVPGARFDGSLGDSLEVARKVQRTHMANSGWGDIGYHFLIDSQGRVIEARDLRYQGAHAGNSTSNKNNIGICLIGHFGHGRPSPKAMASLERTLADLRRQHSIRRSEVYGHKRFKATDCPGPALMTWTEAYRRSGPPLASLKAGASSATSSSRSLAASTQPAAMTSSQRSTTRKTSAPRTRSVGSFSRSATVR